MRIKIGPLKLRRLRLSSAGKNPAPDLAIGVLSLAILLLFPFAPRAQEAPDVDTVLKSLAEIGPDALINRVNELKAEAESKSAEAVELRKKAEELDALAVSLRQRIETILKFTATLVETMVPKPPEPAPAPVPEPAPSAESAPAPESAPPPAEQPVPAEPEPAPEPASVPESSSATDSQSAEQPETTPEEQQG